MLLWGLMFSKLGQQLGQKNEVRLDQTKKSETIDTMGQNGMIECVKVKYDEQASKAFNKDCKTRLSSLLSQLLGLRRGEEAKTQYNVSLLYV